MLKPPALNTVYRTAQKTPSGVDWHAPLIRFTTPGRLKTPGPLQIPTF
jgi:hypothetical protein